MNIYICCNKLFAFKYIFNHRWIQNTGNRKKKEIVSFYSFWNFFHNHSHFLFICTYNMMILFSPSSREIWRNTPAVFSNRCSETGRRNVSFLLFSIVFTTNLNSYAHIWLLIHSQRFRDEVKQAVDQNAAQSVSEVGSESEVNKLIIPRSRPTLHRTVSLSEWLPPLYQLEDESWDALYWAFIQKIIIFKKNLCKK